MALSGVKGAWARQRANQHASAHESVLAGSTVARCNVRRTIFIEDSKQGFRMGPRQNPDGCILQANAGN
jgi:hypothetical protein